MSVRGNKAGFTLVEIMIVVAIIGLLAAIAVPNFLNARQSSRQATCVNNLRQLAAAQDQWALETNQAETAAVTSGVLDTYVRGAVAGITCPLDPAVAPTVDSSYGFTTVNADPTCSNTGLAGANYQHIL